MVNVGEHITRLLYDHDCVIIPGVGGFIANYRSSYLHDNLLYPPSRTIHFNRKLNTDDGLLISDIASEHNLTYESAKAITEAFSRQVMTKLQTGKGFTLDPVGTLSLIEDDRIVFEPSGTENYLPDAFGLQPVRAILLNKGLERQRQFKDRRGYASGRTGSKTVRFTLLTSLPVIAFLLWGIIDPVSVNSIYQNSLSSTTIFPVHKLVWTAKQASQTRDAKTLTLTKPEVDAKAEIARGKESLSFQVYKNPAPVVAAPDAIPQFRYYIIGGAFKDYQNAEEFVSQLSAKGFNPEILEDDPSGTLHKVSYFKSDSRKDALAKLEEIRSEENTDAWLYVPNRKR